MTSAGNRPAGTLGVIHVPKSGGSALRAALGQIPGCYTGPLYFDEAHFGLTVLADAVPSPNRETITDVSDLADVVSAHRVVIGHYAAKSLLGAGCGSLALQVREPRARLLSLYTFWRSASDSDRASWGDWGSELMSRADLPLGRFLSCPEVWPAVDNVVTRQTMGYRLSRRSVFGRRSIPSSLYEDFRCRVSIVEWSSRSEDFLAKICAHLGILTWPALDRVNITEGRADEQSVDEATLKQIMRLTRADRTFLDRLSRDGLLPRRSAVDLDSEFEVTAGRLGFRLSG